MIAIVITALFAPQFWVRWMLWSHSRDLPDIPGTGAELARHLIRRFELDGVVVEETEPHSDHYSPADKAVRLSPDIYHGKSLTAVAVATHEVGHAIQFKQNDPTCDLFVRYVPLASRIQRIGIGLMSLPLFALAFQVPRLSILAILFAAVVILSAAFVHMIVLPQEWDASFNKAMPIIKEGHYVDQEHWPAVTNILRAAALTYVASALTDVFRCWRWGGIMRGLRF